MSADPAVRYARPPETAAAQAAAARSAPVGSPQEAETTAQAAEGPQEAATEENPHRARRVTVVASDGAGIAYLDVDLDDVAAAIDELLTRRTRPDWYVTVYPLVP